MKINSNYPGLVKVFEERGIEVYIFEKFNPFTSRSIMDEAIGVYAFIGDQWREYEISKQLLEEEDFINVWIKKEIINS